MVRKKKKKPVRYGSPTPRIFTAPLAPLEPRTPETEARTAGYDVIDFATGVLKVELLPWQKWLLIHALELHPDGGFRFRTIVVLVARQNGKTMLSRVLALWFMYVYGYELILGTAQDLDTAEETWEAAVEYVDPDGESPIPELASDVKKIWRVNGKKQIQLKSGARYKVKASSKGSGRGLSGDLILLDELREHHDWKAWSSMTKTTIARADALIWCMSNAGDIDSVVLAELRRLAHEALGDPDGLVSGENAALTFDTTPQDEEGDDFDAIDDEETLGFFEWSTPVDAKPSDREYWPMSNPSLGHIIPERNLVAALRSDPEAVFRTECMCQWVQGSLRGPFPPESWERGIDPHGEIVADSELVFGVDMAHDRSAAYVAVAGFRPDGDPQVEIAAMLPSAEFVVPWFADRVAKYGGMRVVFQGKGAPVTSLAEEFSKVEGLEILDWSGPNLGAACGQLYDAVKAHMWNPDDGEQPMRVWHTPQPVLDRPAASAVTRPLGDSWIWDRAKSPVDPSPLMAVTAALWCLLKDDSLNVSVYEDRGLLVL